MIAFDLRGVTEVVRELEQRASAADSGGVQLIEKYREYARDLTHQLAPKDTHFMAEHVVTEVDEGGMAFETGWRLADFEAEGFAPYYFFQEFGTIHMEAQPSLGPAWNELEPTFIRDGAEMLRRTIVEGR